MARIGPEGFPGLELDRLRRLRGLDELPEEAMVNELRRCLFDHRSAMPSLETLVHAFLPPRFIDHTHADAILALTNQPEGDRLVREALGGGVIVLEYRKPGFALAKAAAESFDAEPGAKGMVWMRHGIVTWGETARESYEAMIDLVARAEAHLARSPSRPLVVNAPTSVETASERVVFVAPVLRGLLAQPTGEADRPHRRVILMPLIDRESLDFVDSDRGRALALTPPLTSDHLVRTKPLPLWIDAPPYDDTDALRTVLSRSLATYTTSYEAYVSRHAARMGEGVSRLDPLPRVVLLPGLGALCAGPDAAAAEIVRDITSHTLAVKRRIAAMGSYEGLDEKNLFDMEYCSMQHAKLAATGPPAPLGREVALVTGGAGAIGSGICRVLLEAGCLVAATDLPGERLDGLVDELREPFDRRVIGAPMDVTDPESVSQGFAEIIRTWGGIDLVVINAGIAHVSPLTEMTLDAFRRLERVNVEGTMLILKESARLFERQGTGGDIVLVSSKNVFAPGGSFGAYSATKAGAHQLARIASLELAPMDVRVNMVSPDAVFSEGGRKSGLWAEVGPDRMRARGLDEAQLEEFYRNRSLLKSRVTARHVGRAVLFFATRQTPTTGATIPVDGGLPDATPR
jgi:rhamnose utilization protein RhaD (predicted bifunctional aldolase and dehydrogenase)/NAD(P)-dependent dehydrogenase (short-subunit alcohol dehydrogenase family)